MPTLKKSPVRLAVSKGFTLTELAIVLFIVALLIGGMMVPLSAQIDQRNISDTNKTLAEIREALIGYAASHQATATGKPYLPCPTTDNSGTEDRSPAGDCKKNEGWLPWVTLGVGQTDAWNNRFRYSVKFPFAYSGDGFKLDTTITIPPLPSLKVCDSSGCTNTIADNLPVVILSHGKNGAGATTSSGLKLPDPAAGTEPDEFENVNDDATFVSRTPSPAGSPSGEFDDIVTWLPTSILFSRMIAAGRLP